MKIKILKIIIHLLSKLPLPVLRLLAWILGTILYWLPNREKHNAEVNLNMCFPELTEVERRRLLRQTLIDNALNLIEMPAIWLGDASVWKKRIDPGESMAEMQAILDEGKGMIIAAPHLGNWEITGHLLADLGGLTALYRPPRQAWVETFMTKGREQNGAIMVPTTRQGIKALFKTLADQGIVFILPDQQPKKDESGSVFAPFFAIPALTMTLLNRMAEKTDAPVYFLYAARVSGKYRYRFYGHRADADIKHKTPEIAAAALNAGLEKCARQFPSQYQWTYRRFEARPDGAPSPYKKTV